VIQATLRKYFILRGEYCNILMRDSDGYDLKGNWRWRNASHAGGDTRAGNLCSGGPELRDKALAALNQRDKVAKKLGITIEGGWTNMPGHTIYMSLTLQTHTWCSSWP